MRAREAVAAGRRSRRRTVPSLAALFLLAACALRGGEMAAAFGPGFAAGVERYSELGPYPVGVRTLVLTDADRRDPLTGGPRTLVTDVWYPASEASRGSRPTTFVEFFGPYREAAAAFVAHFGGELEEVNRRFRTVAVRDAPLRPGRYPLLVFSHGNGGVRHQNVFQLDHLASHGYLIATPDHTGNAGVAPLPSGPVPYDRKGRSRSQRDRPRDVSFVLTRLLEEGERPESWLRGAIDPGRIGVLGHSLGGFTASKVAESDPRVQAALAMTVAYGRGTSTPFMTMLAGRDRTIGELGNGLARLYFAACTGPRYLVALKRAGHFTFTDMDRINPRFGDGIGTDPRTGEAFLDVDRAKRVVNFYTLAFFDRYLRGIGEAGDLLRVNPDPEEVDVQVDPEGAGGAGPARAADSPAAPPDGGGAAGGARRAARALIVTGDDVPAHDWRATTPVTRRVLEAGGRVEAFVCEEPGILAASTLGGYDLVVLNFRNPPPRDPGEKARENLAAFVRRGGGLVVIHFAVFAFPGWEEYGRIAGRIWVGSQGGKKVSGHAPRGPFRARIENREHPVTRGLEDFETDDELYSKLVGEAPIEVLVAAHSEYSGREEPVAWVLSYGEGRVFVTVLGHDVRARENAAFGALLERGAWWAAGGS